MELSLVTPSTISKLPTKDLIAIYNSYAETPVKKFTDRKTAEKRTLSLIEQEIKKQGLIKKPKKRVQQYHVAPNPDAIRWPKVGTIRRGVIDLLDTLDGATFEEIESKLRVKKRHNTLETLRIIHSRDGFGLWQTGDKIRLIKTQDEYLALYEKHKNKA